MPHSNSVILNKFLTSVIRYLSAGNKRGSSQAGRMAQYGKGLLLTHEDSGSCSEPELSWTTSSEKDTKTNYQLRKLDL